MSRPTNDTLSEPEEFDVPEYTIFACVIENRVYRVAGRNADDAADNLRDDYELMEYDVLDREINDVTVEDVWTP